MFAYRPKFNKSRMSGSSYFDIDSILAESEPVVTEVLMDCYNMDSLESGAIKLTSSLGRGVDLTQLDKELDMIPELKESAVQSEETRGAGQAVGTVAAEVRMLEAARATPLARVQQVERTQHPHTHPFMHPSNLHSPP